VALPAAYLAPGRSLLYPVRKYRGEYEERICTYEAAVALLDALGGLSGEERDALLLNLKLKVDALLRYKNRRASYGEETGEILEAERARLLAEMAGA
jgi:DTW domain-containing protein YfiP